jgi:hypothetical protein
MCGKFSVKNHKNVKNMSFVALYQSVYDTDIQTTRIIFRINMCNGNEHVFK